MRDLAEVRRVLKAIAEDMEADAKAFDGKPFNGRTVAEYFGNQGAAIAGLAHAVDQLYVLEQERLSVVSTGGQA